MHNVIINIFFKKKNYLRLVQKRGPIKTQNTIIKPKYQKLLSTASYMFLKLLIA